MAEVLFVYPTVLEANGQRYQAQVCGAEMSSNTWEAWIEFLAVDGKGQPLRSGRETTQPNRTDAMYWATGLTPVYLEGALHRALHPLTIPPPPPSREPVFDAPAPVEVAGQSAPVSAFNPFSVFEKGEMLLQQQLSAMAAWRLVDIIRAHRLSDRTAEQLSGLSPAELIDLIVEAVKRRSENLKAS